MNYAQLEDLISSITYKPGYRIQAQFDGIREQVVLHLVGHHPDATGQVEGEIPIVCTAYVSTMMMHQYRGRFEDLLLMEVRSMIRNHELHEVDEWLKIGGKHVKDPHPAPQAQLLKEYLSGPHDPLSL